jgi:hypothetical protein
VDRVRHRLTGGAQVWEANGVRGHGDKPAYAEERSGSLLVMGGGRCVWEDLEQLGQWSGATMTANEVGAHYQGSIDHWASLHPDFFPFWIGRRSLLGMSVHFLCHAQKRSCPAVDCVWSFSHGTADSGLFAVSVGLAMGYDKVVLAGVPLDNDGHYYDAPGYVSTFNDRPTTLEWEAARESVFEDRVRSLSGRTRSLLGAP